MELKIEPMPEEVEVGVDGEVVVAVELSRLWPRVDVLS